MLEDRSGRLTLVGAILEEIMLVTGCIVAVMGTENTDGEFEVIDLKLPDLPVQPPRREQREDSAPTANGHGDNATASNDPETTGGGKVAIVSGLSITGDEADGLARDLLEEILLGEAGGSEDQRESSSIHRLIIAGNSLATSAPKEDVTGKKPKKYGYDAAAYNAAPITHLDNFLAALLPSMPVTLLPGESDPANISMPQQPLHTALFPKSRAYASHPRSQESGWLDTTTNPWEGTIDGWRFLGNSGQPVNDIFKYVDGDDRLLMMESILRWRIQAPTAPDTLCES